MEWGGVGIWGVAGDGGGDLAGFPVVGGAFCISWPGLAVSLTSG